MKEKLNNFNNNVALWLTLKFGSMWACYAFLVYGLLPLLPIFHNHQVTFMYWSNFTQLIALPLIMVGTNILGKTAEERSIADHETLAKSYQEQKEMDIKVSNALDKIQNVLDNMNKQDEELKKQDEILLAQTDELKKQTEILSKSEENVKISQHKLDEQTDILKKSIK